MSWDAYVNTNLIGSGTVSQAAILGLDGTTWAASKGFKINKNEAKAIIAGFKDPQQIRSNGIRCSGMKYMLLRTDDRSLYGKLGAGGVCCVKTNKAVLVGTYNDPIQPGQCTLTVEKLADYLIGRNM